MKIKAEGQSDTDKWILRIIAFGLFLVAILVAVIFYQIYFPPKIIEITQKPVKVKPAPVYAGKPLTILLDYCKYQDVPVKNEVFLEGKFLLPAYGFPVLPLGCHENYELHILIPAATPDGVWHLRLRHTYRASFLQEEIVEELSEKFKILPNPVLSREM